MAGGEHTCALMQDSTVRCWGKNGCGQLGLGHTKPIASIRRSRLAQAPMAA
ncbi:MAG TPA: RCC1 domain-containing protein [Polyangia bacterium]